MRDRWEPIDRIFDDALERSTADRELFVMAACGGDDEVAGEVLALLRNHDEARLVLGESADAYVEPLFDGVAEAEPPGGRRVGPYRIVREIGRGLTSTVYLAQRDEERGSPVALKLVSSGIDAEEVFLRFRYEGQALVELVDPNIARFYDLGVADEGLLYLVMEYVEGRPISGYCDAEHVGLRARLDLFRTVCRTVQFAHQNLVVHRDLKPSDILVTAEGTPKLLGFGIAGLLGHDATGTAADVHALGIVLHELLTGTGPITVQGTGPSSAASTPQRLRRHLRGDLDSIVLKALEEDPGRGYQSVQELLDDLDRHRSGLPVRARRQTAGYRLRRYLGRHRAGITAVAALLLLVTGLAAVYTVRVGRERDRARVEAARARATTAFLTDILTRSGAGTPGDTLSIIELLDRDTRWWTPAGMDEPTVRATLQTTLGRLYLDAGEYSRATPLLDSAVALQRTIHGPAHEEVARALRDAAKARNLAGDYSSSDSLYHQALAIQLARLGPSHPEVAVTLGDIGDMLARSGRADSAEPLFNQALAILQTAPGDHRREIADSKFGLALLKHDQKKLDQAESLLRDVLALRRELGGNEQADVALTLNELGTLYLETGRYDWAQAALQEALGIRRKLLGDRHPQVAEGLNDLASIAFGGRRDYAGADSLWREALGIWQGVYGRNHRTVGKVLGDLGQLELQRGSADSALALFLAARDVMRTVSGEVSADAARMTQFVGIALQRTGHLAQAQAELERSVEMEEAVHGPSHLDVADAELSLAHVLRDRLDLEGAETHYTRSIAMLRDLGAGEDAIGLGLEGFGRLRLLEGREVSADSLLREALLIAHKHYEEGDERLAQARIDFGLVLLRRRRPTEAESLLVGAFPQLSPYEQSRGRYILAELYDSLGQPDVAATYRAPYTSAGADTPDRAH